MSRRKYCPNCGANVEPEGKYCIVCGSQLTDLPSGAVEEVPEFQSKPGKKVYCRFCGVRLRRGAICTCDEGIAWAKRIARAEEEAACKKAEEEEAARRNAEEEAARKKAEEEEAARKKAEEEEAARKKAEEEEAARKKAEEEEAARKKAEEEETARRNAEEEAARKKAEEEEAARRNAEEEAARKKAEEEEAARRNAEKEAARKKEEAETKKRQEEAHAKAVRSVDERREAAEKTEKKRRGGKRVRRFIFLAILVGACVYFYRIGELDSYLVRFGLTRFTSSNSTGVSGNDAMKIFGNEGAVQMDNQAQMGIETGDAGDQNAADVPQADEKTNEDIVAFDAAGTDLSNYHAVPMTASATASYTEYPPANIVDGNTATVWEENVDGFGSGIVSITLVPGESEEVRYLTFKLGRWDTDDPADTDGYQRNSRPMNLSLQINENDPKTLFFADEKKEWMIDLVTPVEVSRINVTLGEGYRGTSYNDVAITEITAYAGNAVSAQADTTAAAVSTDVQVVAEAPEKTAAEKKYQYISFTASDTDEITWEQAEAECEAMGGQLASIRSMDDFYEIVDSMPVSADSTVVYHMYLGGIRDISSNNPASPTPYYWYDGGPEDKLDNYDLDSLWLTVDGAKEPTFNEVIHGELLAQTVIMMFNYKGEWVLDDVESDYASVVKVLTDHSKYKIGYIMEKEIET